MDQHSLSLKLFKKQQSKTKKHSLSLKRKRNYKKSLNENFVLQEKPLFLKTLNFKKPFLKPQQGFKKPFLNPGQSFKKPFLNPQQSFKKPHQSFKTEKKKFTPFYLKQKGQVLLEGLFFIVGLISFLLAIQFFQTLAQKEIQKERIKIKKAYRTKKSPLV